MPFFTWFGSTCVKRRATCVNASPTYWHFSQMGNLTVNAYESLPIGYFKRTSFLLHSEVSALVWVWCLHIVGDDPTCDGVVRHDGGYLRPDARVLTHPDRQFVTASPWRPLKINVTGCGSDVNEYRYWNKTQTCIITNASRLIIFNSKLIIRLQQMCFCVAFFLKCDWRSLSGSKSLILRFPGSATYYLQPPPFSPLERWQK